MKYSFNELMEATGDYKTKQEGIKHILKVYKMGLLTYTEKEDLIATLNWYWFDKKDWKDNYISMY